MARFFIDRPVFATVLAIIVSVAGLVAITTLPVAQFPAIAPPRISITANYPGASARTLEDTVTQVIEQKMKGIDRLRYMSSNSDASGQVEIDLTFESGTDPDIAQVQVQNKLALATPLLPQEVQQQGITVAKAVTNFVAIVAFYSEDGAMTGADIADYVGSTVQDQLSRVTGVGDAQLFGAQYAMRIWLDPARLTAYKLTPSDVIAALRVQNAQISAGQLGALPASRGQQLNATIIAQTRLSSVSEFERILLRARSTGAEVRLRDVARVELGGESYVTDARFNTKAACGMGLKLATGANALGTVDAVKAKLAELAPFFPNGLKYSMAVDNAPFVRISIEEVVKTLVEAVGLVFLVMLLFMQNLRATLIPTIAVPVVLLGTFGVLAAFGYSINTLTMFAMVLAIGLLVDDAIVVVENVERVMHEEHLPPREAARRSMDQISGALVGIALVLSAVFVPMAFFGGSTGVIYRQFSITIVSSMVLSVLVAMVLTPALCATLLEPVSHGPARGPLGRFFAAFNRGFAATQRANASLVGRILPRGGATALAYLAMLGVMAVLYVPLPSSFLPDEDQGQLFTQVQLPAGATKERTQKVLEEIEQYYLHDEKDTVKSLFTVNGFNFGGMGQNTGMAFVQLRPWDERTDPQRSVKALAERASARFSRIRDASIFAFAPPAVIELGNASGFDVMLVDRGNVGHEALLGARNQLLGMAARDPVLMAVRPNGQDDAPQLKIEIDHAKAEAMSTSLAEINATLSAAWGSAYVNDFLDRGRVKKVFVQSDAGFRMLPGDLDRWYVRNQLGGMVPFSAFATSHWAFGPTRLERYNGQSSLEVLGAAAPGRSTGDAMRAVEALARQLPRGVGIDWTGLSLEERDAGGQAPLLYALSLLIVFLCLAALYESWSVPIAVLLVVPLGVIGALVGATLRGFANDVYFQVGLLTTAGLSAKNAILIVEFAKGLHDQGRSASAAAIEAVRLRLRPIVMTSLAFMLGVLPLTIAHGAGSGGQRALGTAVLGGTLAATLLSVFFVPAFFVGVQRLFSRRGKAAPAPPVEREGEPAAL